MLPCCLHQKRFLDDAHAYKLYARGDDVKGNTKREGS
jgi:hypothetical protein